MDDEDIKSTDKNTISHMLYYLKKIMPASDVRACELDIAFTWFQSRVLDRRLHGIVKISDVCRRMMAARTRSVNIEEVEGVLAWLVKKGIVEELFGPRMQIELVKQCLPVLKFIAVSNQLSMDHLDAIWSAAHGRHEADTRSVHGVIIQLLSSLSMKQRQHM